MQVLAENILNCMEKADRDLYAKGQLTALEALDKYARKQEKKLHSLFNNFLLRHDLDHDHSRMDKRATIKKGRADYHIWRGRLHCFVEFKSEEGRLRPEQKEFVARQEQKGTPILVTCSYAEATQFVVESLELDRLINILA